MQPRFLSRLATALLLTSAASGFAQDAEQLKFDNVLYSGSSFSRGTSRSAVFTDRVLHQIVTGEWKPPQEGDPAGTRFDGRELKWESQEIDDSGVFQVDRLFGGYFYLTCELESARTVIVRANGNSELYINGEPRSGDYYSKGWVILPVQLNKGTNEFLYRVGRGRNKSISIEAPPKPVFLSNIDMTAPDFLTSEIDEKLAAIRIVNTTDSAIDELSLISNVAGVTKRTKLNVTVAPLSTRKVIFKLQDVAGGAGKQAVNVQLFQADDLLDESAIQLDVKAPSQNYRRTFISAIDGSLQYYGVRQGAAETGRKPALFLSVHGAGVKALGQAGSYQAKDWGHVIAPTNRREFGFDWEDWGRLDAMEALEHAEKSYGTDPQRTYLTGHSMGGHGTWYLGATYPDRWGAIAPMAGWRSFFSYARLHEFEEPSALEEILNRSANPSRTLEMSQNYMQHGIFIHHGDADRSVPVSEARFMREHLATFHPDVAYFEEKGGAHWYGVDHQPVFDYFKWHELKNVRDLEQLNFRVPTPGLNSTCRYITLYQQEDSFKFCGVVAKQSIRSRRQRRNDEQVSERKIDIDTENLKIFKIDLAHCVGLDDLSIEVDGESIDDLPWPAESEIWLERTDEVWAVIAKPTDKTQKNPTRYGGFKDAFRHNVLFVYATSGHPEENRRAFNKARFDAETFYYRGNGSIEVISDKQFSLSDYPDRSVILYGNADTNSAWSKLLSDCPVQVSRGKIQVGERVLERNDVGLYMVRPRPDSDVASVGVIAATGAIGDRAIIPNRYFLAGTGYPDLMIVSPEMYSTGASGVTAAGFFGNQWDLETGQIEWNKD